MVLHWSRCKRSKCEERWWMNYMNFQRTMETKMTKTKYTTIYIYIALSRKKLMCVRKSNKQELDALFIYCHQTVDCIQRNRKLTFIVNIAIFYLDICRQIHMSKVFESWWLLRHYIRRYMIHKLVVVNHNAGDRTLVGSQAENSQCCRIFSSSGGYVRYFYTRRHAMFRR